MNARSLSRVSRRLLASLVCGLFLLTAARASAAFDTYIKFSDASGVYAGEVTTPAAYAKWTSGKSVGFGASAAVNFQTSPPTVSRAVEAAITLNRNVDRVSPTLFLNLVQGGQIPPDINGVGVTVDFVQASTGSGASVLLRIELKEVRVTSQTSDTNEEGVAEDLQFSYSAIRITYQPNGPSPVSTAWNFRTNTDSF